MRKEMLKTKRGQDDHCCDCIDVDYCNMQVHYVCEAERLPAAVLI